MPPLAPHARRCRHSSPHPRGAVLCLTLFPGALCFPTASGTAVGAIHGIARSAILHPVRVLDAKGAGGYSNIISGMQWCDAWAGG